MSRAADIWGMVLLYGCTLLVVVYLLTRLSQARSRQQTFRYRALLGLNACLLVLAIWLISTDHFDSWLIILSVLVPTGAVVYLLIALIVAVIRRTKVWKPFAQILAAMVIALVGTTGSWLLMVPEPFTKAAQPMDLPAAEGWAEDRLMPAFSMADEIGSLGVVVIYDGKVALQWGDTAKVTDSHSVRKSILSVLIGIAVHKDLMDLDATLEDLGIDDKNPPLTAAERQATVEDLLTARSGIYHPYVGDEDGNAPAPGSHAPGTYFYYNNWDFNTLGAIFERETGYMIGRAIREWLAEPIGMQDFREEHVMYERFPFPNASYYPAYKIWISTRDLARFGLLLARDGLWDSQEIVPAKWIEQSTTAHSSSNRFGYGHSWWRSLGHPTWLSDEMFLATGTAGQKLLIDPKNKLVVTHRTDTRMGLVRGFYIAFGQRVDNDQFLSLTRLVLDACPKLTVECPGL